MSEWNDILVLTEADDEDKKEEEKKDEEKDDDKEEDKKESEKKEESDDDKDDESSDDNDYNDILDDSDLSEVDSDDDIDDLDTDKDSDSDSDEEYNDLMDGEDLGDSDSDDALSDDPENPSDATDSDYNTLIVVKSEENADGSVYDVAAKLGYTFTVIANNMKHIHLNACGRKFEELHEKCDDYYSYFARQADWCFELASESPLVKLDNPTRAKEHCEDVEVEQSDKYGFEDGFGAVLKNMDAAISNTNKLREASETLRKDVQSKCDDILQFLNKESKYFIRKRLQPEGMGDAISETEPMGECYNSLI